MKEHLKREQKKFSQERLFKRQRPDSAERSNSSQTSCSLPVDDLLETNALIETNQPDKPLQERYFKFIASYVNLNSSCRITEETITTREVTSVKAINETEIGLTNMSSVGGVSTRPRTKNELGGGVLIATRDDVLVASATGGEEVTVIREGSFVPKDRLRPSVAAPLGEEIVAVDVCREVCPNHQTTSCPCEVNDRERLKALPARPARQSRYISEEVDRVAAHQIVENVANAKNDFQTDRAFMGREELLSTVNLESGQDGTRLVPPTECDSSLVLGLGRNDARPARQKMNNTQPVGGLLPPRIGEQTIICVGNNETNRFLFQLDRRYNNVKSVKIISSTVPIYDTIINRNNNRIVFQIQKENEILTNQEGSEIWEYSIPIGNYTVSQLGQIIQEDINALLSEVGQTEEVFQLEINELRNRFEIKTIDPFTFNWEFVTEVTNCRSLYQMLGFDQPKQSEFTDSFGNSSFFRLKLDDYVLMKVKGMNQLYDCLTKTQHFNKIVLRQEGINPVAFDQHLDLEAVFDNSEGSFEFLDVSFVNQDGQPVDFDECDFSMTLAIVEYADRLVGQNFNTRRGFIDYTSVTRNTVQKLN
jgi:hypothetical protein